LRSGLNSRLTFKRPNQTNVFFVRRLVFRPNHCKQGGARLEYPHTQLAWLQISSPCNLANEMRIEMQSTNRRLMWHGMFLFLIGLFTGFAETHFANTRMGLAAHLEGVMNGTFLLALGAIWTEVRLSSRTKGIAYWTVLYGTYGNWLVTLIAAGFGTAVLSPITAAGHSGKPWQETTVLLGFLSVGITIITASVLVLWGLRAKALS